jgi:hypothetical protein
VAAVVLGVILYNATVIDRVPPSVSIRLSATAPDSNLALTMSSVDIVFNENVQRKTAQNAFSITPQVEGTFYWQGFQILIFTPSQKLPLDSTFHVHVAPGVVDMAGNVQGSAFDFTFTTVGNPVVKTVSPAVDEQSVPLDGSISVTFDRLMDIGKVLDGLEIEPGVSYQATWNGPTLTLRPVRPLQPSTTYTISIDEAAADGDGNVLQPYKWSFTTVGIGLTSRELVPADGVQGISVRTPIAVVFDGPIDRTSVAGAIVLSPAVTGTIEATSLPTDNGPAAQPTATPSEPGDNVLLFTPDQPLEPNTTYTVTLGSGVRRTDGRAAASQSWSFSTGEPVASAINRILFLSDRGGASNVWIMNPDGSGQRQVTAEVAPVTAFDVNTAGDRVAYAVAGQVKRMDVNGDHLQTTSGDLREYAPVFTPDGTGLVVARRDASGNDLGFYRIPLISGTDERQVLADGAPELGSDQFGDRSLPTALDLPAWGLRQAFSDDAAWMLVARAPDNALELVEMEGDGRIATGLTARSRPVWSLLDKSFYVVASDDGGASWGCWRIATDGTKSRVAAANGDLAASAHGSLAYVVVDQAGVGHIYYKGSAASEVRQITTSAAWSERSPWFSPDGSLIVFGRVSSTAQATPGGIWITGPYDAVPRLLSSDGVCPRFVP